METAGDESESEEIGQDILVEQEELMDEDNAADDLNSSSSSSHTVEAFF
jgi:hypothetical protein